MTEPGTVEQIVSQEEPTTTTDQVIAKPVLQISGAPGTLLLTWKITHPDQLASVYEYNSLSGEELLVRGGIAADQQSLTVPSKTALREWQADHFRVELCVDSDCVSSEQVAVDVLVESTVQTLEPVVFLEGERFAESVAVNSDASVVVTNLPLMGTLQVHFRVENRWFSNKPIDNTNNDFEHLIDVTTSGSGDTLAVLMVNTLEKEALHNVSIVERLGESWVATTSFTTSVTDHPDATVAFDLSVDGDQILFGTDTKVTIFHRQESWSETSVITPQADGRFLAATINEDFTTLFVIEEQAGTLWLVSYQRKAKDNEAGWVENHRSTIQGVDSTDVRLQSSADATSLIIAGWQHDALDRSTPTVWRYLVHSDAQHSVMALDSVQLMPTTQSDAALRFSTSKDLDTIALGWQSESGNDAFLKTFKYNAALQEWRAALELPADIPVLTKKAFIADALFSDDGMTLIIVIPPDSAAPASGSVGELLVIR